MKRFFGVLPLFFLTVFTFAQDLPKTKHIPLPESEFLKHFQKISPAEWKLNPYARDAFLITAGNAEHYNSMTAGWGCFGSLWSRPVTIVYVRNERFTWRFLEKEPIYTLDFFPGSEKKIIHTLFGRKSGRDTDKVKLSGYTPVSTPGGGVAYLEANLVVVCKKLVTQPLSKEIVPAEIARTVNARSYHVQYTGEILSVWRKK